MAAVSRIRLYPVKSLSGVDVDSVPIRDSGRLQHDREYALFSEDGTYVNGRQNKLVHQINTTVDLAANAIDFAIHDTDRTFACDLDGIDSNPELEAWLTDFFDEPITVERAAQTNFTDSAGGIAPIRITATGPTLVGEETMAEVASWYDDLDADGIFRRLRTNIAIDGVEPFWEDKLYSDTPATRRDPGTGVEFTVGDVTHYGVMCKPRCVVPSRDPETGEQKLNFTKKFMEQRKERFPEWADAETLGTNMDRENADDYYYLTVVTRLPSREAGKEIAVGDEISIEGEIPLLETH
ncbi:MOSC domain-containing protein beta barrel domain-containing protein [Halococcus morrhuae DSM 1307]|uniref:MOSC domain-containing protein beta barrel domain-containing protein n=1 Tax=Halococcus morrhuae DSM 1307 TaxID=931277 RepID=M0M9F7_HALMO|nr:MOSC N-terminal beta barrel domain-containing protein [Halococcus morrhuae]EMA42427.1 MOSC domain-containing protein beta barrel domain-containing protein [Halococcus morrhuae DSM 1307]